jgi:hypothetical protein
LVTVQIGIRRNYPYWVISALLSLLKNGRGNRPADWNEVTVEDQIDYQKYYALYERRLLAPFKRTRTICGIARYLAWLRGTMFPGRAMIFT